MSSSALCIGVLLLQLTSVQAGPFITEEFASELRSKSPTWEAYTPSENPFAHWTVAEIKELLGTNRGPARMKPEVSTPLADSFDARQTFGKCSHPIRNQRHCGSCWAFGASEALSDNLCVISNGSTDVVLSPQELVSCDRKGFDQGCNGGMLPFAWDYIDKNGLVTDACMPYTSGDDSHTGNNTCSSTCLDTGKSLSSSAYKCPPGYEANVYETVDEVKTAIRNLGAVEAAFSVYSDFMHYKSGVYKHVTGSMEGGHAIKVVGYGHADEGLYWIVANSWGTDWGMDGYFMIYDSAVDKSSGFLKDGGYACGPTVGPSPPTPPVPPVTPPPTPVPPVSPVTPSPTHRPPAPAPPAPAGCRDAEEYCTHKDIFQPDKECEFESKYCMLTCGCCETSTAPSYCTPSDTIVI